MKSAILRVGWSIVVAGLAGAGVAVWQIHRLNATTAEAVLQYAEAQQVSQSEEHQEWQQVIARAQEQTQQRIGAAQQWRALGKQETRLRRRLTVVVSGSAEHHDLTNRLATLQAERRALVAKPAPRSTAVITNPEPAKNIADPAVLARAQVRLDDAAARRDEALDAARRRFPLLAALAVTSACLGFAGALMLIFRPRRGSRTVQPSAAPSD